MARLAKRLILGMLAIGLLSGCGSQGSPTLLPAATAPQAAAELVFFYWADYFPQSVLDDFEQEYGIKIRYEIYDSAEQGADQIRAGGGYDVAIMPPEEIPGLIASNALAAIDYRNIPNFKNLSANFRDLAYDPGNRYSIPFQWGTTGLLVRTDLVNKPIAHWADLWDPEFAGKVALWPIPRNLIPIALKTLGYPANSEDPKQLQAAMQRLEELKKNAFFVSNELPTVVPLLESGQAVISFGWTYDALTAQESSLPIQYILPEEGTLLWSESYVIPASSPHKYTAEVFLNYVLSPEVSAKIITENHSAVPNEAAGPFLPPEIRNNADLFPPAGTLKNADIILPLSPQGQELYDDLWSRFMAEGQ